MATLSKKAPMNPKAPKAYPFRILPSDMAELDQMMDAFDRANTDKTDSFKAHFLYAYLLLRRDGFTHYEAYNRTADAIIR